MKLKLPSTLSLIVLSLPAFSQAPTITSTSPIPAGTVGVPYTDTLKATGPGPITWTISGLPWATLTDSVITGTPGAAGTTTFTVTASNLNGPTTAPFSITIVPATVPSVYTQVYAQLSTNLKDFHDTIYSIWNGHINDSVLYTAQLSSANCNNGPGLVTPASFASIETEILKVKAIGVKAIAVEVSFPMLYQPFMDSSGPGLQAQFLAFYTKLADTIRSQGFKLIVECQSLDAGIDSLQANWPKINSFYAAIPNFNTYVSERAATAALVASTMKPDYIILQGEPATEQSNSGQPTNNIFKGTLMLDSTLTAVRKLGIPGMKVGAGFDPWTFNYEYFAYSFTQTGCGGPQPCVISPLDFVDIHVFPIIEHAINCDSTGGTCEPNAVNFQTNLLKCLAIMKAAKMPVTVSQSWLRKVMNSEWDLLSDPPYSSGNVEEAREPYDFWIPQDTAFLNTLYAIANYSDLGFMVPFDTPEWSAYMQWSNANSVIGDCEGKGPCGTISPSQVFKIENTGAKDSLDGAVYTVYGQFYHDKIVRPADVIPPTTPTNLAVVAGKFPTMDTLSWAASTDNIGVAGYHVWRIHGIDTVQLHDIFQSPLVDKGLTIGYSYCYLVQAFDLGGNASGKAGACTPAGVNNITMPDAINIYPNPSKGLFTIDVNTAAQKLLQVFDVMGNLVHSEMLNSLRTNIDLSNLAPGVYNVSISNNTEKINKRLVIIR